MDLAGNCCRKTVGSMRVVLITIGGKGLRNAFSRPLTACILHTYTVAPGLVCKGCQAWTTHSLNQLSSPREETVYRVNQQQINAGELA